MITRRLARPLSAFSSTNWVCPSCSRAPLLRQRYATNERRRPGHHVPELGNYDEAFKRDGVPGLLSPIGFQIGWTQYQAMVVQKLNELTAGEPYENMKTKDLVTKFARDPMAASLFNHASMAFNNHHFFAGLSTSPQHLDAQPQLKESLETTFGSIDTLRTTMLDTAAAMFGPGFVWLVWARNQSLNVRRGDWRILTTYLAGTPYPEAGFRHQGIDTNSANPQSYNEYMNNEPTNAAGFFGPQSAHGKEIARIPPGGTSLMPVLCVNTWEHVYIYDYGIPGKRRFLSDWWEAVDWHVVKNRTPDEAYLGFAGGGALPRPRSQR